jgi:hypothetical protein
MISTSKKIGKYLVVSALFSSLLTSAPASAWTDTNIAVSTFGGNGSDVGKSIAFDSNGNIYAAGYFSGTADFDPSAGVETLTAVGSSDVFVSKLDSSGHFLWAKNFGGASGSAAYSIAVNNSGDIYIGGIFYGTADFDPGAGVTSLTSAGNSDAFIAKLDSSGNFLWARSYGNTSSDEIFSIGVDGAGNVYSTGYFRNTVDFNPGAATVSIASAGSADIVLWKLDSSGNYVWAKTVGGALNEYGQAIEVDSSGNVYVTGNFYETVDFDPGVGTTNLTSVGSTDAYIAKLDASGNFIWAKSFGSTDGPDAGASIAVDVNGNVYTVGTFNATVDLDPSSGVASFTSAGWTDVFISKLDSSGNFLWGRCFGGTGFDYAYAAAVDGLGNIYSTGNFTGAVDFDPGAGVANLTSAASSSDAYISKLDSSGNFGWAKNFGGTAYDDSNAVGVDGNGYIYAVGGFRGTADFDPETGVANIAATTSTSNDVFILRINSDGDALVTAISSSPSSSSSSTSSSANADSAAEAAAAVARRQAEIRDARIELARKAYSKEELSVQLFAKADISGVTSGNIEAAQAEIFELPDKTRSEISQIAKVVRKYEVIGMIASERLNHVYSNLYVEIGLIPADSKNKVELVRAVRRQNQEQRESYELVKTLIQAELALIKKRNEHLASVLARNTNRNGK